MSLCWMSRHPSRVGENSNWNFLVFCWKKLFSHIFGRLAAHIDKSQANDQGYKPFLSGIWLHSKQGILKGEVSLYSGPPVWLVWNQLYDNWQFLFYFAKQTNPNLSNRRSAVQWYFPLLVFPGLAHFSIQKSEQWPHQSKNKRKHLDSKNLFWPRLMQL